MARMSFDQVIDFIMGRLDVKEHERRATRDKVRKRVRYGLGDGSLPRLDLQTTDVDRDEFIYWARVKWPGKFNIPIRVNAHAGDNVQVNDSVDGLLLPADLQKCHDRIRKLEFEKMLLQLMLDREALVVAKLRPLAEQYERNREKNRESASKPRDGGL